MHWSGAKLKVVCAERELVLSDLARQIGVSRQTVYDWISGQVPKGTHLLEVCRILEVKPASLFEDAASSILVPAHRTRKGAKTNPKRQKLAAELAQQYEGLCTATKPPVLQQVIRATSLNEAAPLAARFRELVGLGSSPDPMDYEQAFRLLEALGICVVWRTFPKDLPGYAFYVRIGEHRLVVVNLNNNVLDVIFPLIHEAVHAARDGHREEGDVYTKTEEDFCDAVASAAQFPPEYIERVHEALKGLSAAAKVNVLKAEASMHHHALYGLVRCMEKQYGKLNININPADTNLHKGYPTLAEVLHSKEETPSEFLERIRLLSPIFYDALREGYSALSMRKLAEILELPSVLDAQQICELLDRETGTGLCTSSATHAVY